MLDFIKNLFRARQLRKQYYRLSFQTHQEARRSLVRQIKALQQHQPGKTEVWYLEKILYDLQKDRR